MTKKSFNILLIALFLTTHSYGQKTDIDSLGNIWIITVDKSGSMLWNSQRQYTYANRIPIASSVARRLFEKPIFREIDYNKDKFIFFNSGILRQIDLNQLKHESRFDTSFIHHTDEKFHTFRNQRELVEHIKRQLERGDYIYTYSFVSQIRLFSIVKGLDFVKEKELSEKFNRIFLITITDDADQNDQWMNDYKTVKKYAPQKLADVNDLTTKYLFNPFNAKSDFSKSGVLHENFIDESELPRINFYEYRTTQSLIDIADSSSLFLSIYTVEDSAVNLQATKTHFKSDSILFFYIDSITINNLVYPVKQYFTDTMTITAKLKNSFNYNKIIVNGYFQVSYTDSILGQHFKKYQFQQSGTFPSAYWLTFKKRTIIVVSIILLILAIYYLILVPRRKLFMIYDNQGRKYTGRKGAKFYGKYSFWERGEHSIISYVLNHENTVNAISKKTKSLTISKHHFMPEEKSILIVSNAELIVENQNSITITPFTTKNDIEEYHETRSYNLILKSIYQKTIQYYLFKIAKNLKLNNTGFFYVILFVVNLFSKRYYYLISLTDKNFKDTSSISFSCKSFMNRTFTIEFTFTAGSNNNSNEINKRNISCLNDFFSTEKGFAGGIIAIHILPDQISWNVLKPEYQNSLRKVYHVFHFQQQGQEINGDMIRANITRLRKLAKKELIGSTDFKTYITVENEALKKFHISVSVKLLKKNSLITENKNHFTFTKSVFQNFLYLIETKNTQNRKAKRLYSPFTHGLQTELMTESPTTGEYHIFSCFAPDLAESGQNDEYSKRIANNIFSFSTKRNLLLSINSGGETIHYANHTLNLNNL